MRKIIGCVSVMGSEDKVLMNKFSLFKMNFGYHTDAFKLMCVEAPELLSCFLTDKEIKNRYEAIGRILDIYLHVN